jgi:hypothetical protein
MDYPIALEGFEGHEVSVHVGSWGSGTNLYFDGEPAERGPKRNQFVLTRNDGNPALVKFRTSMFDPVPVLDCDGTRMHVAEPLPWHVLIWCFLPLAFVFSPGIDGILVGFAASWANHQVFRSERPTTQKYLLTAGIDLIGAVVFLFFTGRLRFPPFG